MSHFGNKDNPIMHLPHWPHFAEDEIAAVNNVLKSGKVNYWTGEQVKCFEKEFAAFCGTEYAIALANGTLALELALLSLNIGANDEVIVPSRTFIATASCVIARSATPVCADVDKHSQNISVDTIENVRTAKTKAIIVVHLAGLPCDMDPILDYANQHNLFVIEDCAQALGARYKNRRVGTFGHAAAFSFCQDKILTTGGEGGMLVTNSESIWKKAWSYKDHGKNSDKVSAIKNSSRFQWVHDSFGSNWRLTEMQAAIGRQQLKKLPSWLEIRRSHAATYQTRLADTPGLILTHWDPQIESAYYKYYVFIDQEQLKNGWTRDRIIEDLTQKGVPCFTGICPEIYREEAFMQLDLAPSHRFENAKWLGENSIMLLLHPTLATEHIEQFCRGINETMKNAVA